MTNYNELKLNIIPSENYIAKISLKKWIRLQYLDGNIQPITRNITS